MNYRSDQTILLLWSTSLQGLAIEVLPSGLTLVGLSIKSVLKLLSVAGRILPTVLREWRGAKVTLKCGPVSSMLV
ncbi:hypothetical protein LINPERHAP2_LOCUS16728 [Linum perenne]